MAYVVIENAGCDEQAEVARFATYTEAMKFASKFSRKAANPACVDVMKEIDGTLTTEI